MLNINNLKCSIKGTKILEIKNLKIDKPGLYIFLGPSGCGKTTLLNIIAGLNRNFSGDVTLFHRQLLKLRERDLVRLRSSHLSIYFQHNTFIEDLTLAENISLAGLRHTESLRIVADNKVAQIASKLKIEPLLERKIRLLSGGEKTRGAIARTLFKESPMYIFDEPTAALDPTNARLVMDLIKEKASRSIVIMVTHDQEIASEYANKIIKMEYGEIVGQEQILGNDLNISLSPPKKIDYLNNSKTIAGGLLNAKRLRHFFTGVSVNIGLVGLGLSLLLVNAINTKLLDAFRGEFDQNTTYIRQNFSPTINVIKSVPTNELYESLHGEFSVGTLYLNDLRELFPDDHGLSFNYGNSKHTFPSFHIGLFNEPLFLNEIRSDIEPYVSSLLDDELGLVLPFDDFKLLQNAFRLPFRSNATELGHFLAKNPLVVTLNLSNKNWDYDDEQSFTLRTVTLGQEARVIFGKPDDAKILFEEKMMLPSSLNLTRIEEYPWTLKKVNFIYIRKDEERFMWSFQNYPNYVFSAANSDYFRFLHDVDNLRHRFLVFEAPPYFNNMLKLESNDNAEFYTFGGGLSFIAEMMLVGFSQNFFFAADEALLSDVIQLDREHKETLSANFTLPTGIVNFAIQYNSFSSFNYKGVKRDYLLHEIGISKGLAQKLFGTSNVVGQEIAVGALLYIEETRDGYVKHYQTTSLKIIVVEDSDDVIIYHHPLWSYYLFLCVFGVSPFNMQIYGAIYADSINLDLTNKETEFTKTYPYREFKTTINSTLRELEEYTMIASLGAFLLSSLIIFMIIYLLIAETNEQFSGLYLMGYSKDAIQKVIRTYISRFLGSIILLALGQLFLFSFVIEFVLSNYLGTHFYYVFNLFPYAFVLIIALLLMNGLLNLFRFGMNKLDLLVFSKRDL